MKIMNNTVLSEETYSFWKLINKYKITIPMIQRDYVQGKEVKRINEIREKLINNIKLAIQGEKLLDFDFIYGSTKINEDNEEELSLLDGQQRITTLFLLHWYFAKKECKMNDEVKNIMHNFSYQNRVSSREFCKSLVDKEIKIEKNKKISDLIRQKTWYYSEWNNDPTVKNMLNMLDCIHENFYEYEAFDKLIDENNSLITFMFIPLEKFNLTDELYIKMNSRGKKLTNFEIFKSKILEIMKEQNEKELLEEFSEKIESSWADFFFSYKKENEETFDEIFMRYIYYITEMIYATKISTKTQYDNEKDSPYDYSKKDLNLNLKLVEETYKDKNNIKLLISILNIWKNKEELTEDINKAFSSKYSEGKVMLFDSNEKTNLFENCIYYENFEWLNRILLFSFLLKKSKNKNDNNYDDIRIIRNISLNIRSFYRSQESYTPNIRYYMLRDLFNIFEKIIDEEDPYLYLLNESFISRGEYIFPEIKKAEIIKRKPELKKVIFECEDTNSTKGNLVNLINLIEKYEDKVIKLIKFFNDKSHYPLILRTMLSFDNYGIYIGKGNRYFYGSSNSIYDVLTYSNNNEIQSKIQIILEKIFEKVQSNIDIDIEKLFINTIKENMKEMEKNSWRYNVVKYAEIWELSYERIFNKNSEIIYTFALNSDDANISSFSKKAINSRHINPYYKPLLAKYNLEKQKECYSTKDDNGKIILNNNIVIKIIESSFQVSSNVKKEEIKKVFIDNKIDEDGNIFIKFNINCDYIEQLEQIINKISTL